MYDIFFSYSPVYGHPTDYVQLLGDIQRNDTGHIIGASALLSMYMVHVDYVSANFDEIGNDAGTSEWVCKHSLLLLM
jgi:hypothetical protein